MRVAKKVLRIIISVLLSLLVIALIIVNIASSTVLSREYLLNKLEETDYYNKIYELSKSNFENYIQQSGLEEEVLTDLVTVDKIKKDTNIMITNIYDGLEENVDTESIKTKFNENLKQYMPEESSKFTDTEQKAVDKLIDTFCNEYKNTISHFEVEDKIYSVLSKIVKYIGLAKKTLLVLIGICVIILISINTRRIYKNFTIVGVAGIASGLFFTIVNKVITSKVKIDAITILNEPISISLRSILQDIVSSISKYGIVMLIIGLVLVIFANLIHNILKYKNTEEDV